MADRRAASEPAHPKAHGKVSARAGAVPTRPRKDNAKRRAILEAAREAFMARGFGDTSMEGVALTAGASKVTVYAHFATKADLFRTVIEEHCRAQMGIAPLEEWLPADPALALEAFATRWRSLLAWPDAIATSRIVVAEVSRFPELGQAFIEASSKPMEAALADYLEQAVEAGRLSMDDPRHQARLFLDTLRGGYFFRMLMGIATDVEDFDRDVAAMIATLMAAHAPGPN